MKEEKMRLISLHILQLTVKVNGNDIVEISSPGKITRTFSVQVTFIRF